MKKKMIIGSTLVIFCFMSVLAFAATITISPNLPGSLNTTPSGTSPGAYIKNFYSYALFLSGLLAFGAIVYGGIKYAVARGNPSGESEAKQWIWSALLGMLLLAGAYIILFTVNPNLVNLALPALPAPAATVSQGNSVTTLPNGQTCQQSASGIACLPSGSTIQTLPNGQVCQQTSAGLSCLTAGTPVILPNGQLCSETATGMTCVTAK